MRVNDPDEWIEDDGDLVLVNKSDPDTLWIRTSTPINLEQSR